MVLVVLDTDFLLDALRWKVNITEGIREVVEGKVEIVILEKTLDELKGKKDEQLARTYLTKQKIAILPSSLTEPVDAMLLSWASEKPKKDLIVATQDAALKEKLKKRGLRLLTIRQQRYITRL